MKRISATRPLRLLQLVFICSTGCNVYDAGLSSIAADATRVDASIPATPASEGTATGFGTSEFGDDAGPDEPLPRCGNGTLDPGETCDLAIHRGSPGACPEGCSGRSGCTQQVLVGRRCTMRCEEQAITQPISSDGCCPLLADAQSDSDCDAVCGDGVRERAESCDPPETCVSAGTCTSPDACHTAHYSGTPERCDARCELRSVEGCVAGDGCCPLGCTHDQDEDCEPRPACDETCVDAGAPSDCQVAHGAAECESCDCAHCARATTLCLATKAPTGSACEDIVRCAAQNACSGLECLCGRQSANQCQRSPAGPCVLEFLAASGVWTNVFGPPTTNLWDDGPIARALQLLSCRREQCAAACKLD